MRKILMPIIIGLGLATFGCGKDGNLETKSQNITSDSLSTDSVLYGPGIKIDMSSDTTKININVNEMADAGALDYEERNFVVKEEDLMEKGYRYYRGYLGSIGVNLTPKDDKEFDYVLVDRGRYYDFDSGISHFHHYVIYRKTKEIK